MGFMPGTGQATPPLAAGLSIPQSMPSSAALTDGGKASSSPLAMTRWNALTAKRRWYFLNYISNTKKSPLMNFMKGPWQKPGPDAVLLDFFFCLYHTVSISRQEAQIYGWTAHQGTQTEIYPKSPGRNDPRTGQEYDWFRPSGHALFSHGRRWPGRWWIGRWFLYLLTASSVLSRPPYGGFLLCSVFIQRTFL